MKKEETNFILFAEVEPPRGLLALVMQRIEWAQRKSARVRLGIFSVIALLSGVGLVPATQYVLDQLYRSGFYDYFSLLFSDHTLVLTYWREFGLVMLDTLPSVAILLLIPVAAALVWSLRQLFKNAPAAFAGAGINI